MGPLSAIFPFHEPLHIFTMLIATILLSPFLFRFIKLPDVGSFIIVGVLIGPYGLNILARDSSIELLGTVGLLYIMFIAGLELDINKFKISKKNSIVFGILTFTFPFIFGFVVSRYLLHLGNTATLLVSIMFSTHTLVAYPIARRLGINRDISVLTAVGGTIITDTLVLLILSVIIQLYTGRSIGFQTAKILTLFAVYLFIVFYTFPKIAQWFFKYIKRDRPVHYLFLLLMVCVSSVMAEIIGLEAIIGAFVAGLALNRSIPKNSLLMHHVDFVGNILFIPIFLISIGMLINTKILFSGVNLWYVSTILILAALAGKWIAAYFSQKILKFSTNQRSLLFGLSSSHAAATIAIILIGYQRQIIDETIFNATILIILVSSLIASIITQKYGKKLAITLSLILEEKDSGSILVPVSNPSAIPNLVSIANSFQPDQSVDTIYVLTIINDDKNAKAKLVRIRETLEKSIDEYNNLNENLKVITRVDLNVSSGILRAAKEYMVSDIVFGWSRKTSASERIFGSIFDHLLNSIHTLYACNLRGNLKEINKVTIQIPDQLEREPSFGSIITRINSLPIDQDGVFEFQSDSAACLQRIKSILPKRKKHNISFQHTIEELTEINSKVLSILFLLRKQSIAFNPRNNNKVNKIISSHKNISFIIVVPGYD